MTLTAEAFHKKLEEGLKCHVQLILNQNRRRIVSVLKRSEGYVKASVHQIFLDADDEVFQELLRFLKGRTRKLGVKATRFMYDRSEKIAEPYRLDNSSLDNVGRFYNLELMLDDINREYFNSSLNLGISWFGETPKRKKRKRIVFGLYDDSLKLVKIHRMMDNPFFPEYFVRYVIYHEVLHSIVRPRVDDAGACRSHHSDFKRLETYFKEYLLARDWEKRNKELLFDFKFTI